ncbi:MAG TPA: hypothetical protein VG711_03345, partial [Phycisphaerales bacterium]|nr:hypothetical protein [Phycisphaerales bacterium]
MILNFLIIGLVALIAYWWANQGVFSAILHLLCTIVAGAIAFGLWEWVVVRFLLSGSQFDQYAWGLTLAGLFVASLLILRLTCDKIVRANVRLPHTYDLVFGLPIGAASGILTIGILTIACGFTGSEIDILGYTGYARSSKTGKVESHDSLWFPVHTWTAGFYSYISATSLTTSLPMADAYPQ